MSQLNFSFSGISENSTKFVGKSRNFQITIDEPPNLGGNDEAPNPVEYTLASLAGCLNVVAHLIAKELKFEIKSLKIHVDGNLNPLRLLNGDKKERAGYTDISVKLDLVSDASAELQKKWLDIVKDRCPVSDNLANITKVEIKI